MSEVARTRVAVLGSPIAHSKSPAMHSAAYAELGVDWTYTAVDVPSGTLSEFLARTDETWRGLSLTMPLKREVLPLLDRRDGVIDVTGGANTVLFADDGLAGFNTDVYGIVQALRGIGVEELGSVLVLGAGATAASAAVAAARLGAGRLAIASRTPANARPVQDVAERLGMSTQAGGFDADGIVRDVDLVVSTVPGGTVVPVEFPEALMATAPLFDVAYDPWPTDLAARWTAGGGRVVSGIEMLLHQALAQVRIFVSGNPDAPLADERRVFDAMRRSVGLPAVTGDA